MLRLKWLGAFCALSVVIAACGRDSSDSSDTTTATTAAAVTTTAATTDSSAATESTEASTATSEAAAATTEAPTTTAADPCAGATLESTETGISADTITVLVMADVGSELAPGLFQGSIDGTKAWAKAVNDAGGLACRQVEVIEWDSKLNPTESTNGFLEACSKALAMVGTSSLFVGDVSIINTCTDKAGAATGIPDLAQNAVGTEHQCSPNVFTAAGVAGACPYSGTGVREYAVPVGAFKKLVEIAGEPLHGIYLIPSDLPSTIQAVMPTIRGLNDVGFVSDGEFGASGRAEQATYGEYIAAMQANNSNFATTGSNDQSMIKLRTEAKAQGLDESNVTWSCSIACYTQAFREDPNSEGTWITLAFLPFEERAENSEIDTFLTNMGVEFPQSWAVAAWNAGRALEVAVNKIVAAEGPNSITRAKVLESMKTITDFDSNGWIGTTDFSKKSLSPCFVLMQVEGGEYVRRYPEEVATMDCSPENTSSWTGDSASEYKG